MIAWVITTDHNSINFDWISESDNFPIKTVNPLNQMTGFNVFLTNGGYKQ